MSLKQGMGRCLYKVQAGKVQQLLRGKVREDLTLTKKFYIYASQRNGIKRLIRIELAKP